MRRRTSIRDHGTGDHDLAEGILSASLSADDAPPQYRHVVGLLEALNAPPAPAELAAEDEMVGTAAVLLAPRGSSQAGRRRRSAGGPSSPGRRLTVALAAAGAGCV
ncbi:MAG TPA: hypothetical protein VKI64_10845, partial [Acidimicrobiales bacterium]|nr:hypothetical protein [Acidimicrobiales bacterium]